MLLVPPLGRGGVRPPDVGVPAGGGGAILGGGREGTAGGGVGMYNNNCEISILEMFVQIMAFSPSAFRVFCFSSFFSIQVVNFIYPYSRVAQST